MKRLIIFYLDYFKLNYFIWNNLFQYDDMERQYFIAFKSKLIFVSLSVLFYPNYYKKWIATGLEFSHYEKIFRPLHEKSLLKRLFHVQVLWINADLFRLTLVLCVYLIIKSNDAASMKVQIEIKFMNKPINFASSRCAENIFQTRTHN